jgi:hypothetical protein
VTSKTKSITLKNSGEVKSIKALKRSLKRRSGSGQFLKRIPADGLTSRFLTEPDKWFKFFEHYDESREDDRYFPCTEDCPGCDEGLSSSKRYLVNALDVEDNRVVPLVLPASLASNLLKKYDKFGTMMDRNYDLSKSGSGFDTEYDALYDGPTRIKTSRYELLDLEAVLLAQLGVDDDDEDEDDDDDLPNVIDPNDLDDDDDDDDIDDVPDTLLSPKERAARNSKTKTVAKKVPVKRVATKATAVKKPLGKKPMRKSL